MSNSDRRNYLADAEKIMSSIEGVVRILGPLDSEERQRVIQGALVVLREPAKASGKPEFDQELDGLTDSTIPTRARVWMRQNDLTGIQLSQVFDISDGEVTVISSGISGKNNSEKTIRAYVLAGLAGLLSSGDPVFDDKAARELCETLGCYDNTNHSKYMKDKGNNFVGDKDRGWKLTAPGLKFGALVVKSLSGIGNA
jgi:hypothetical protein